MAAKKKAAPKKKTVAKKKSATFITGYVRPADVGKPYAFKFAETKAKRGYGVGYPTWKKLMDVFKGAYGAGNVSVVGKVDAEGPYWELHAKR